MCLKESHIIFFTELLYLVKRVKKELFFSGMINKRGKKYSPNHLSVREKTINYVFFFPGCSFIRNTLTKICKPFFVRNIFH